MLLSIRNELLRALRVTIVVFVVTGLIYPFVMTGLAQGLFHGQANGGLITKNGQVVGSTLIGQYFTSPRYFQGRPSATTNLNNSSQAQPYNAANSGASNYAPSNPALIARVKAEEKAIRKQDGLSANAPVPVDAVTSSFSGVDPDISEAYALLQVNRIASARGLSASRVQALVENNVQGRVLFLFGSPYVNVLQLNMDLDAGQAG
jgi:potassium-transporting ATPase KdpC subunit